MERKFIVMTDTASDLPQDYYKNHNIEYVPLGFQLNGVSYGGDVGDEMEIKTFYEALRGGSMPTTFQVTRPNRRGNILNRLLQPVTMCWYWRFRRDFRARLTVLR